MNLPGFAAESSLAKTRGRYAGRAAIAGGFAGEVVPASDFFDCWDPCMKECLTEDTYGALPGSPMLYCVGLCTALCGDPYPELQPGFFDPPATVPWWQYSGVGGSPGAVAGWLLVDVAAIAWAVHDIYKAAQGPAAQPAVARGGCVGGTLAIGSVNAYSIPFTHPGCAGAWDRAQTNAQEICD